MVVLSDEGGGNDPKEGKEVDFVVVQWANGVSSEDCQEVVLEGGSITVGLGVGDGEGGKARAKL